MKRDVNKIYEEGAKWWLERIKQKIELQEQSRVVARQIM